MANSNSNRYKMSLERLEELKKELVYMETVREKEVSEQIKEARSFGDLSENRRPSVKRKSPNRSRRRAASATFLKTASMTKPKQSRASSIPVSRNTRT